MSKRIILPVIFLLVFSVSITFAGFAQDKLVIHHTGAFSGEVKLLNKLMSEKYGPPSVIYGKMGRTYYSWETGVRSRLVTSTTKVSMHNAVLSPALIFESLPDKYEPDIATHGGICGAVLEESHIMDIYAPYAVAFSAQGLYGPDGFKPGTTTTWDPNKGKFINPIWIRTDGVLTNFLAQGVMKAKEDPDFQALWKESGLPYQPTLYEDVVQVSSAYFVANDELNAKWAKLFKIDPNLDKSKYNVNWNQMESEPDEAQLDQLIWGAYDGKVHEVGGLAMESAAVVWTFRQYNIPTAVLRYPSDEARSEAQTQIKHFGQTAAAVGGYSFYYGLEKIIEAIEEERLMVEKGEVLLKKPVKN